jgi:alkylhydroperoxidase family enzyme
MARLPYLDKKDLPPEFQSILDRPINLNRGTAHAPAGRRALMGVGNFIRYDAKINPRIREMAILQVGYLARSDYEWSHHLKFGYEFGVTDADIQAVIDFAEGRPTSLDELTTAALRAARELTLDLAISDATFAILQKHLDNEQVTELVVAIAYYNAVVRMLAALKIDVEPDYQKYLDRFPLPKK